MKVGLKIIAAALVALLMPVAAAAEPVKLRVGWVVAPAQLPPVVFQKKSIMENLGKSYDVEFIRFRGSSLQVTALATNEVDIGALAYSSFVAAVQTANLPIKAIADIFQDGPGYSTVYAVRKDSGIKSIKDLKGKTIAVNAFGGAIDVAARVMLLQNGLEPQKDVTLIEARFPAMASMLREQKVDVSSFVSNFWAKESAQGDIEPLFHMRDAMGTSQMIFHVARDDFIAENRDVLVDFYADYIRALQWFHDPANRKEAVEIIAEFTKTPANVFEGWVLDPKQDYHRDPYGRLDVAALQNNVDQLQKLGFADNKLDVAKHVDNSIIEAAIEQVKQ